MRRIKLWFAPPRPETGDFQVRGIGRQEVMPGMIVDRPTGTADYFIVYFHDPVRILEHEKTRHAGPGRLMIWEPRHVHCYGNPEKAWCHSWIHCSGTFVKQSLEQSKLDLNVSIALPDPFSFNTALSAIYTELTTQSHPDPIILKNVFQNMLRRIARTVHTDAASPPVPAKYLEAKHHMELNYAQRTTLKDLAQRFNLSAPYFCNRFKRYFGVSPMDFLISLRMHAAMHHLRNVNYTISQIAEIVGYSDIFYFSKTFKKRFGASPTAIRRQLFERETQQDTVESEPE